MSSHGIFLREIRTFTILEISDYSIFIKIYMPWYIYVIPYTFLGDSISRSGRRGSLLGREGGGIIHRGTPILKVDAKSKIYGTRFINCRSEIR